MHSQSHLHLPLLLLTVTFGTSTAQSPPTQKNEPTLQKGNMSSSMSILLIILISVFIFLAFFSVYIRQYIAMNSTSSTPPGPPPTLARSVKRHGLNPETLSSFPTLIYSEVKEHTLSKSVLECAVCLNEFEDSETLRLLPNCSHAFHTDCIDAWLDAHVTCPVCRCNLTEPVQYKESANEHVLIEIEGEDEEEREREMNELEQFVIVKRGKHFVRSYTTGHAGMAERGKDLERYTLRLPENVKNAIMLKRTSSCVVFRREESEKRGFRTTEKLGSFLKRAMSMKNGRFLRWDSGKSEGSARSKGSSFRHVVSQFDCCPGSSGGGVDGDQFDKVEKFSGTDSSRQKD